MDEILHPDEKTLETHLIVIFVKDSIIRKELHRYYDKNYPSIKKTSLLIPSLGSEWGGIIDSCRECNKSIVLSTYHDGICSDNIDEWASGDCRHCGEHNSNDIYYISDHPRNHRKNVIVLGEQLALKRYQKKSKLHSNSSSPIRIEWFKDLETYLVPKIVLQSNKNKEKQLVEHVDHFLLLLKK